MKPNTGGRQVIKIGNKKIYKVIKKESEADKNKKIIDQVKKELGLEKSRPKQDVTFLSYQNATETVVFENPALEVLIGPRGQQYGYILQGKPNAMGHEEVNDKLMNGEKVMENFEEEFEKSFGKKDEEK